MLLVARKNLMSERIRLFISVGGVAMSVFLITILLSLFRGWNEKVGSFVEDSDVDVWVAAVGTNDFLAAASVIPLEGVGEGLSNVPAVEEWSPIIVRPMTANALDIDDQGMATGETEINIHLIGYDAETGMSGPIKVVEGPESPGKDELIIDEALSSRYGIAVGDRIDAAGREWEVVGKSSGGNFVASYTVFGRLADVQEVLSMTDLTTFIGIRANETVGAARVAESVAESDPRIVAYSKDEFAESTREEVLGNVIPILTMILVLAFIVGLSVAGLTIYTSTVEKAREYGILKAVGFKNSYLYRLVFEQSMVIGAMGFVLGAGGTILFSPFATDVVPQFVTLVRWQDIIFVLGTTIVMSAVAGYVPVRKLAGIDPTTVFKA